MSLLDSRVKLSWEPIAAVGTPFNFEYEDPTMLDLGRAFGEGLLNVGGCRLIRALGD